MQYYLLLCQHGDNKKPSITQGTLDAVRIYTGINYAPQNMSFIIPPLGQQTNSMEPNPSWEANSCSATLEFPSILQNPKVHYHINKSRALVSIVSQVNPVEWMNYYVRAGHNNSTLAPWPSLLYRAFLLINLLLILHFEQKVGIYL
jgi:hypothetical protein